MAFSTISKISIFLLSMGSISLLFAFSIIYLFWHMIRGRIGNSRIIWILLLPVVMLCFAIYGNYNVLDHPGSYDFLFFTGEILGIFLTIYYLYYFVYKAEKTELEMELNQLRYAMQLKNEHYREIERNREKIARIRHDFKNQILTVKQLMDSKNKEEAEQLLSQIETSLQSTNEYRFCSIPIVNAVLEEKSNEFEKKDILLETSLLIKENIKIDEISLCSLFSNLLDNAEHAVERLDESKRRIKISAITKGGYMIVKTYNASNVPEAPAKGHGYGTQILQSIASRYGGSYRTEYKDGVFAAIVTLELNDENCCL